MDETRLTAHLPGLDIEISRQALPGRQAETLVIGLRATPSFEAVGRALGASLLPVWGMPLVPFDATGQPWTLWNDWMRALWAPWLALVAPSSPQ